MDPRLQLFDESGDRRYRVERGRQLVGRHPRARLRVFDASVAFEQFWLDAQDDAVRIEPVGSSAATYVNGEELRAVRVLCIGDRITAGAARFRVLSADAQAPPPPSAPVDAVAADDATLVGAAGSRALLDVREIPLRGGTTIGRGADADLSLPSVQVSRRHARIDVRPAQTTLTDLGSSNGTFVNGVRLQRTAPLSPGDVVAIGPYELTFTGWSLEQRGGGAVAVAAIGVAQDVADAQARGHQKRILLPTDLVVRPGEFVAILGESGGGKSTLVNLLAGRAVPAAGQVLVDGRDLHANFAVLRSRLGFVPQRNMLFDDLSVQQNLLYTARLRLPADTEIAAVRALVVDTLRMVGLDGHGATRFRDLSGGQKKRASLANEILVRPGILFVDEVTSGLDEGTDREIMELLHRLSRGGVTIVCITHTLRHVAELCDRVVVLAQPGQLVYVGTPAAALRFFAAEDLGGVFARLKSDPSPVARSRMRRRFVDSDDHRREVELPLRELARAATPPAAPPPDLRRARAELLRQTRIVTERAARLLLLDRRTLAIALGQAVLIALAVGAVFGRVPDDLQHVATQQTIQFLLAVSCLWFGCSNASKELVKERELFRQEADVNLRPFAYLVAKAVVFGALGTAQVLLLATIVGALSGIAGGVAWQLATLVATVLAGTALGLCISAFARDRDQANTIVPIVLVPQIIMAGRIARLPDAVEWFAGTFVTSYWSYSGMDAAAAERWSRAAGALGAIVAHAGVMVLATFCGLLVVTRSLGASWSRAATLVRAALAALPTRARS